VSLGLVLFYNLPFWREMLRIVGPLDAHGIKLLLESFLLVTAFYNLVLSLFNWPYIGKPLIALLLLITSFISYFMNQYGVMIDVHMVQNAVQTDHKEVRDLLTGRWHCLSCCWACCQPGGCSAPYPVALARCVKAACAC
jgi:lipid A ethanolaminephosphotransferase